MRTPQRFFGFATFATLTLVQACTTRPVDDSSVVGDSSGGAVSTASGSAASGGAPRDGSASGGGPANTGGRAVAATSDGGMGGVGDSELGGSGAGGGSGGSAPKFKRPELVTSGQAAGYFKEGHLVRASADATIKVLSTVAYQTMHGFGGAFSERGWVALRALGEQDRALAMKLLFSAGEGANLTWGRIPMGADAYARERYTYDDISSGADYPLAHFSIENDLDDSGGVIPYVREAQKVRGDIRFWGVPWTPPTWMKTEATYDGGSMKNDRENLDAYAHYFVEFIQAYQAQGIPIHHVFPQQEPDWVGRSPGCAWGPAGGAAGPILGDPFLGQFVVKNLVPALLQAELATEVWYGTFSDSALCPDYWQDLVDAGGAQLIRGAGLEWSCNSIIAPMLAANPNLIIMMTEHTAGNLPWRPEAASLAEADQYTFWKDQAPNNHSFGVETWEIMKSWIVDHNVNAYSALHMVLDDRGFGLATDPLWPQNSLLAVDIDAKKLIVTPAYYVFRHISQFVDDGAVLIRTAGGNAMAFRNPDASIVTVIHNEETTDTETVVDVDGEAYAVTVPAGGWATLNVPGL